MADEKETCRFCYDNGIKMLKKRGRSDKYKDILKYQQSLQLLLKAGNK